MRHRHIHIQVDDSPLTLARVCVRVRGCERVPACVHVCDRVRGARAPVFLLISREVPVAVPVCA